MQIKKYQKLQEILKSMESVVIAYSGGTDSTLVLKAAHDALGDKAIAMTAVSVSLPTGDRLEAMQIAEDIGVKHILVESEETSNPEYLANTPNRCFFCKQETYSKLSSYAKANGYKAIADGTNADDSNDFRPGRKAASEYGVRSPLQEAGFTKEEIRELSRELGLPNWDKPAAACLSSRIPYGTVITTQALSMVERSETFLRNLGLKQLRVRHHGTVARVETEPADFPILMDHREEIIAGLKEIGYTYISLDLSGFHSGSMNDVFQKHQPTSQN
jgi:uncharacterized protein